MTGFTAPLAGSVERFDTYLADREYLPAQYQYAFDELVRQIQALQRETDNFVIPSSSGARAWQAAMSIYSSLKRREADEERRAVPAQKAFLDDHNAFSQYVRDRHELFALFHRGEIDEFIAGKHLDLVTDDMADPLDETNARYGGRRIGWVDRAQNIASALRLWHSLSSAEKRLIQTERTARKLQHSKERHYG